MQQLI